MVQRLETIGGIQSAPDVFSPVEKRSDGTWFIPESFRVGNKWSTGALTKDFIDATGAKASTVSGVKYVQPAAGVTAAPETIQRKGYTFASDPTPFLADSRAVSFTPGQGTSKLRTALRDVGPALAILATPFAVGAIAAAAGTTGTIGASGGGLVGGGLKAGGGLGLKAGSTAAIGGTAANAGTASLAVSSGALASATPALGAAGGTFSFAGIGKSASEALATAGKAVGAAGAVVQAKQTADMLKDSFSSPSNIEEGYPGIGGYFPESLPDSPPDAYITNNTGSSGNMIGAILIAAAAALFFIGRK